MQRMMTMAAALVAMVLTAAHALALSDNFCYDIRGQALEVPPHFH